MLFFKTRACNIIFFNLSYVSQANQDLINWFIITGGVSFQVRSVMLNITEPW